MTAGSLAFGSLSLLLGRNHIAGPGEPCIMALGDGADMGNPEAVIASVASMLMDGDKARINRYGNQEIRIPLEISGEDLNVVAAGEALVMAEVNRGRNIITWTPPGPIGPAEPNVHDVVYSRLEFHFDDLSENRAVRKFTLILECAPFARRAEPTVVVAEPVPNVPAVWTTIDDCSTVAGWSTGTSGDSPYPPPALGASGGRIWVATPPEPYQVYLTRFGLSAPIAAGEYLTLDFYAPNPYPGGPYGFDELSVVVNGGHRFRLRDCAVIEPSGPGRARYYWRMASAITVTSLDISLLASAPRNGETVDLYDVSKVTQPPFIGSRLQRSFIAQIGGTARTSCDLAVEGDLDTSLGDEVMIYTSPVGGFQPPLRKWRTSGPAATADTSAVSGFRSPLNPVSEFDAPFPDEGAFLLLGRLRSPGGAQAVDITWNASTGGTGYRSTSDNLVGSASVPLATSWHIHPLGILALPTIKASQVPTLGMGISTAASGVEWDEFWLMNLDAGVLTRFSGLYSLQTFPSRVVARSASLDSPRPGWLVGHSADPSKDVDASRLVESEGTHTFEAGALEVFVVGTNPTGPSLRVTVTGYERFTHHVTRKSA